MAKVAVVFCRDPRFLVWCRVLKDLTWQSEASGRSELVAVPGTSNLKLDMQAPGIASTCEIAAERTV
jgi:hypothetical protein